MCIYNVDLFHSVEATATNTSLDAYFQHHRVFFCNEIQQMNTWQPNPSTSGSIYHCTKGKNDCNTTTKGSADGQLQINTTPTLAFKHAGINLHSFYYIVRSLKWELISPVEVFYNISVCEKIVSLDIYCESFINI